MIHSDGGKVLVGVGVVVEDIVTSMGIRKHGGRAREPPNSNLFFQQFPPQTHSIVLSMKEKKFIQNTNKKTLHRSL